MNIIPYAPHKGQRVGQLIGKGIETAGNIYSQHQRQNQLSKALSNVEDIYSNPQLSESQKLLKGNRALSQFPEVAQQTGTLLSRLGLQQQKTDAERLAGETKQEKLNKAFQELQGIHVDPNISEDVKTFLTYEKLKDYPTLAHNIVNSMHQQKKAAGDDVGSQLFSKGYAAILGGDDDAFRDVIDNPTTPLTVKRQLTDLQNQHQTRQDVRARELRNRQSLVQKSYHDAIANAQKMLSGEAVQSLPAPEKAKEVSRIYKYIKKLEALQKADLHKLTKNPSDYQKLQLWNHLDPEFLPLEEEEVDGSEFMANEEIPAEETMQNAEEILNSLTDEQVQQLYVEANGDIEVAKKLALERYAR